MLDKKYRKSLKGFTLIETMLVTMLMSLVIMMLMGFLFGLLNNYRKITGQLNETEEIKRTVAFIEQEIRRAKDVKIHTIPYEQKGKPRALLQEIVLDEGTKGARKLKVIYNQENQAFDFYYTVRGTNVNISEVKGLLYTQMIRNNVVLSYEKDGGVEGAKAKYYILPLKYKGDEVCEKKELYRN